MPRFYAQLASRRGITGIFGYSQHEQIVIATGNADAHAERCKGLVTLWLAAKVGSYAGVLAHFRDSADRPAASAAAAASSAAAASPAAPAAVTDLLDAPSAATPAAAASARAAPVDHFAHLFPSETPAPASTATSTTATSTTTASASSAAAAAGSADPFAMFRLTPAAIATARAEAEARAKRDESLLHFFDPGQVTLARAGQIHASYNQVRRETGSREAGIASYLSDAGLTIDAALEMNEAAATMSARSAQIANHVATVAPRFFILSIFGGGHRHTLGIVRSADSRTMRFFDPNEGEFEAAGKDALADLLDQLFALKYQGSYAGGGFRMVAYRG
jgi:hypothetical protein